MTRRGALVLVLYVLLDVLLAGWIGRRCELASFPQHDQAVLFCAGVDALGVWPPFEQPCREPEPCQDGLQGVVCAKLSPDATTTLGS